MACDNNKNTPFGQFMDMKVTYTGCGGTCNGSEIKYGMNLREVLDILVGDCQNSEDQRGVAVFASTTAPIDNLAEDDLFINMEDGSISQYIEGSWTDTGYSIAGGESVWGSIGGNIEDQPDLVAYVAANAGISADDIGTNLHLDDDGKLNVGVLFEGLPDGYNVLILTTDGVFDSPGLTVLDDGAGTIDFGILTKGGLFRLETNGGGINFNTEGGNSRISTIGGDFIVTAHGATGVVEPGDIILTPTENQSGIYLNGSGNVQLMAKRNNHAASLGYAETNLGVFISAMVKEDGVRTLIVHSSVNPGIGSTAGGIEYVSGMPTTPNENTLTTKGYVDALQTQITALEARIEALENANP